MSPGPAKGAVSSEEINPSLPTGRYVAARCYQIDGQLDQAGVFYRRKGLAMVLPNKAEIRGKNQ
jgi:hypothetical protein